MKIFGSHFVSTNKSKCKIIIGDSTEKNLTEYYYLDPNEEIIKIK